MLPLQQIVAVFVGILCGGITLAVIGMLMPVECKAPRVRKHNKYIVVFNSNGARRYAVDRRGHRTVAGYTGRYGGYTAPRGGPNDHT